MLKSLNGGLWPGWFVDRQDVYGKGRATLSSNLRDPEQQWIRTYFSNPPALPTVSIFSYAATHLL